MLNIIGQIIVVKEIIVLDHVRTIEDISYKTWHAVNVVANRKPSDEYINNAGNNFLTAVLLTRLTYYINLVGNWDPIYLSIFYILECGRKHNYISEVREFRFRQDYTIWMVQ